jgi:hypothetical protein
MWQMKIVTGRYSATPLAARLFNGPTPVQRATNAFHIPLAELFER